jgi:hypothetical protein
MTSPEKIAALRKMNYTVDDMVGIRNANNGTAIFTINGNQVDEMFVLQLLDGNDLYDVIPRNQEWLSRLKS